MVISLDDIEALAVGAWVLGTGGGGSPYLGLLNMRRLYAEGRRVELMSPFDLADDDWVAVVSNMGAPLVGQERLADSHNIARAVEIQEGLLGSKFRAVMSLEIGGGNGIQPLMAAAHLGLPVVDADTMGRAYPEAQMTSVAVGDLRPYPCVLYDPRGIEAVVTKVPSWKWMERASRKDLRRDGLDRLDLQSPAHRPRGQGLGNPFHRDQSDRHRPPGAGGAAPAPRPDCRDPRRG